MRATSMIMSHLAQRKVRFVLCILFFTAASIILAIFSGISVLQATPLLWMFWFALLFVSAMLCPHITGDNLLLGFGPDLVLLNVAMLVPQPWTIGIIVVCVLSVLYMIWAESIAWALAAILSTMVSVLPSAVIGRYVDDMYRTTVVLPNIVIYVLLVFCLSYTTSRIGIACVITALREGTFPGNLKHLDWKLVIVKPFVLCGITTLIFSVRLFPRIMPDPQWDTAANILLSLVLLSALFRLGNLGINSLSKRHRLEYLDAASSSLSLSTKDVMYSTKQLMSKMYPYMKVSVSSATPRDNGYESSVVSGAISSTHGPLHIAITRSVWNRSFDEVDNLVVNLIASMLRVIYRIRMETSSLQKAANTDPLTGLANYRAFEATFSEQQESAGNPVCSMIFIDVDKFKRINDSYGHQVGNEVLQIIARRLRSAVDAQHMVARLGGDEFVIILSGIGNFQEVQTLAKHVARYVNKVVPTSGGLVPIKISFGISIGDSGKDYRRLMEEADRRMYESRRGVTSRTIQPDLRGGNGTVATVPERYPANTQQGRCERSLPSQAEIEEIVARAIEKDVIQVYYQPIVNLRTRTVYALESLVRYHDPKLGDIPVADIVKTADRRSLTSALSDSMLLHSTADMAVFNKIESDLQIIAINATLNDMLDPLFEAHLIAAMKRYQNLRIIVEITEESMSHADGKTLDEVGAFVRSNGIDISLDDSGTVYSELSILSSLPVAAIKIDKSIVDKLEQSVTQTLVRGLLNVCEQLNVEIVFEGVETKHQEQLISSLGGHLVQGFLYGHPIDAVETGIRLHISGLEMLPNQVWPSM
ncbi:EAL domain-containing protein [Bifidobacterium aquikefiricola]|uniref:EAL domain-containing protein n=1 Tax=Bifidobacterium aquikefiricola TaxID=3059038 RepID=A0AB39U4W0_9BIFI